MDELFKTKTGRESLLLAEERRLIEEAQAGDGDAVWALLFQYRGALQKAANNVRSSVRGLTAEQVEDLQADLVLAAVETIKSFDLTKYVRLSQLLPGSLRGAATEMATSLSIPNGTLQLWFKVWRAAEQDFTVAVTMAPQMGMTANTFRAIQHALAHVGSEWVSVPYTANLPTADAETYRLAHQALALLSPAERSVIEHFYGFRGDPKADAEVALILESTPGTVKTQRRRALDKMRAGLAD